MLMAAFREGGELCLLLALVQGSASISGDIRLDVPFVAQVGNGCGSACISMVMKYWAENTNRRSDVAAEEAVIRRSVLLPGSRGAFATDLVRYFGDHGFHAYTFLGEWADLEHHLARGRPLIVAIGQGSDTFHYLVVAGIDSARGILLANDPARRKLCRLKRADFEKAWERCRCWTLLALPKDES